MFPTKEGGARRTELATRPKVRASVCLGARASAFPTFENRRFHLARAGEFVRAKVDVSLVVWRLAPPQTAHIPMRAATPLRAFVSRGVASSTRSRRAPTFRGSTRPFAVVSASSAMPPYPIGTPGEPWGDAEKLAWRASVETPSRSYADEVVSKIDALRDTFDVFQYGALPYDDADPQRYPLFAVKSKSWSPDKPCVLVTGGVHGYETSGVQGALRFLATRAAEYAETFNLCVAPCVSPWGYERIQRWNALAVDPTDPSISRTRPRRRSGGADGDGRIPGRGPVVGARGSTRDHGHGRVRVSSR